MEKNFINYNRQKKSKKRKINHRMDMDPEMEKINPMMI